MKLPSNVLSIGYLDDEMEKTEIALILELYRSLNKPDQVEILKLLIEYSMAPDSTEMREGVLARIAEMG